MLFRNGLEWYSIISIIVTLIAFDLICLEFFRTIPYPCLRNATTPPVFIKKVTKIPSPS